MLWEDLKSCRVPSRPPSLMLPVDAEELDGRRRRILSQGTLDIIDQSHRARLNGRAELFRELRRKTVRASRVDKEAYVRGICEGVEHHLWSSDSHPAYRGIRALHSSKTVPRCTAVRVEGGGLLTEESEARWASILSSHTRLIHQLLSWMSGVLQSILLTLQSTVIHLHLWKHRLR